MIDNDRRNKADEFHGKSMDLAELAMTAKKNKESAKAIKLFAQAYELERNAAMLIMEIGDNEPTRSILLRSAAWLAFHAEKYREAEKMAAFGLSGTPPHPVDKELREVFLHILEYFKTEVAA